MTRLLGLLTLVWAILATDRAHACGGFFCSAATPVVQNSERIVFVDNGDGTITAIIEIVYQGPSESFSWVLPVSGSPTVDVASSLLLAQLDTMTQPIVTANITGNACSFGDGCSGCFCNADSGGYASGGSDAGTDVTVVGSGDAGPYEYVVISVDPSASNQADTARTWLMDNGYDVSNFGADILGEYLAGGQNLIAFRLSKTATAGSIRPIVMTYTSTLGVIPIRPTAVAAVIDMGVLVFMMGGSRAVPITYDEIELSDTAINWSQASASYTTVIGDAIDEADGHAFVTEFAGPTPSPISLGADAARADLEAFAESSTTGWTLVYEVIRRYSRIDGLVDALVVGIPSLTPAVASQYTTCQFCVPTSGSPQDFDRTAFLDAVDRFVVAPLELSEEVANRRPYLTRLFTTIDPTEMTIDPAFGFASGLPDVARQRTADLRIACIGGTTTGVEVELADGSTYDPRRLATETPKVARRIDYALDGSHTVVTDNTAAIDAAVVEARRSDTDACSTEIASSGGPFAGRLFLFSIFVFLVRRMRPRRA